MMRGLMALCLLSCSALLLAAESGYETLENAVPTAVDEGQVEVVELFWYGCPHCYSLEPALTDWAEAKPDNVVLTRMPAIFRKGWVPGAKAYYTALMLGVEEQLHPVLFKAVHVDGGQLSSAQEIEALFVAEGISAEVFRTEYEGFAVDRMVRAAIKATRDYRITGVPSMIVNGKYRTTATLAGGSNEAMLEVVDQLIVGEAGAAVVDEPVAVAE